MLIRQSIRILPRLSAAQRLYSTARSPRVLVTGSLGQLGSSMVNTLRAKFGNENIVASDIKKPTDEQRSTGPFVYADVLNYKALDQIVVEYGIDWVVHFSAILSAVGERNPTLGLDVNINGFQNILEVAKAHRLRLLSPSTMGAFGPSTPKDNTPDFTIMRPNTIYGITKVHMELLGEYYNEKFGVDFRSLRYPGIISADTPPGGGTTDYAVDIFHAALKDNAYQCFLKADATLPMMYIDDCIAGTMQLLEAPQESLTQRVYNVNACAFSPEEIAREIRNQYSKDFAVEYQPDFRQAIAETWPRSMADEAARKDWGWNPRYGTQDIVQVMLEKLGPVYRREPRVAQHAAARAQSASL
ncbi:NAD(P)-binding protein [Martensiomyces pterosporus]|nr:NAD(P)-binding protein [Martensiomyces pterosporus]